MFHVERCRHPVDPIARFRNVVPEDLQLACVPESTVSPGDRAIFELSIGEPWGGALRVGVHSAFAAG